MKLFTLVLLAALSANAFAQSIHRVDDDALPGGNGSSWPAAFADLQLALEAAAAGDQIWVAEGRYVPSVETTSGDPRSRSFVLPHDVELYGGFLGHEATLAERAGSFAATRLDGDLGVAGDWSDNSLHVVQLWGTTYFVSARLDGFAVVNGAATAPAGGPRRGGGVLVSLNGGTHGPTLTLSDCTIEHNLADQGGGLAVINLGRMNLLRCVVQRNAALQRGGGLFAITAFVTSVGTTWRHNVTAGNGGAFYTISTNDDWLRFSNDVFHDNDALRGGAFALGGGQFTYGGATLDACTFAYNTADEGGGGFVQTDAQQDGHLRLRNSILWGNRALLDEQLTPAGPTIQAWRCLIEGGFAGLGILDQDPQFRQPQRRDLRPRSGSPAHDAGDSTLLPPDWFDLDGDGVITEPLPVDHSGARRMQDDHSVPNTGIGLGRAGPVDLGAFEN